MKFAGFLGGLHRDAPRRRGDTEDEGDRTLPRAQRGRDAASCSSSMPEQHFTQPPPRFSEASLVKELEEKGIGRPSTYAAILSTIQDRGYVEKKEGRFHPTELGIDGQRPARRRASPTSSARDFTAQMEEQLDQVEEGTADWVKLLDDFYAPFKLDLEKAKIEMRDVKREEMPTERGLREVRQADGHQVGPQRPLPGLLAATPSAGTPRSSRATPTARSTIVPTTPTDRRDLPDLRRADGDQARALRRVPRLLALPRLQDDQPDLARRRPARKPGCGGYLDREALAARQGRSSAARTTRRPSATSCRGIARSRSRARSAARRSWSEAREGRRALRGQAMRCIARRGCG